MKAARFACTFFFLTLIPVSQGFAQSETLYDVEFSQICLIDSIAPDTIVQFWRFTHANNPGGITRDFTYDLSGAYIPTGTVIGCNDYYLGDNPEGSGSAGNLAIWTGTETLGNSSLTESAEEAVWDLTGSLTVPSGTDAQVPVWGAGKLRYNTTGGGFQGGPSGYYLPWADADNWAAGYIPYSEGANLTTTSSFQYSSNFLLVGGSASNIGTRLRIVDNSSLTAANTKIWAVGLQTTESGSGTGTGSGIGIQFRNDFDGSVGKWSGIKSYAVDAFSNNVGIAFHTTGYQGDTPLAIMTSSGLGIKNTSPQADLHVTGTARITSTPFGTAIYSSVSRELDGDIIARAFAYAEMSIDDANPDTISITSGTPAEGTDWTAGELANFTYSAGRLTYTGTETAKFLVNSSISFSFSTVSSVVECWVYKNGAEVTKSEMHRKIGTGGDVGNGGQTCILELATNDYIEVFFDADNNGNVIIQNANVNLIKI